MLLGRLQFDVFTLQHGAITEREADLVQTPLNFLRHGGKVAPFHVGLHVDTAGSSLALYDVRGRQDLHIGHLAQTDPFARGCIDQHLLDGGEAVTPGWRSPHMNVVGASTGKDVADFLAGHQG